MRYITFVEVVNFFLLRIENCREASGIPSGAVGEKPLAFHRFESRNTEPLQIGWRFIQKFDVERNHLKDDL